MNIIIMGCGRVGSTLAHRLAMEKHAICLLDKDPEAFELLDADFPGRRLVGNGYNRGLLEQAGLADADAFVAVTSSDNTNIVGARIAKGDYRVPQVVARIYDPRRADIYRELGIPTVASVRWTVAQIHQLLMHRDMEPAITFGNGETLLVQETLPAWLVGRATHDLEVDGEIRVVEVTRSGRSFLPGERSALEADDRVSFAVAATALGRLRGFLGKELGT